MPTVPVINDETVSDAPLPSARLTSDPGVDAFGGGRAPEQVVSAGAQLSNTASEIYDRHQAYADQMFASQASEQFKNIKNNLLYNSDNGLQTLKGQNAFNAPEMYQQRFQDDSEAILSTASNDRQKKVLENLKNRTQAELSAQVQKHVYTETQSFYKETTDAAVTSAINDAVDNYHEDGKIQQNTEDINHTIQMYGAGQGWSQTQIDVAKTKALSKLNSDVIDRMVNNGDDLLAKNYFDHVHTDMTADDKVSTEKTLETGTTRGESQRLSDGIMRQTNDLATAMQRVNDITDPKVRDATRDRVKDNFALIETERRQRDEQLGQKAATIVSTTGDFNQIPTTDLAQMKPATVESLMTYARAKAKGIEPVTDWTKYNDLNEMASNPQTRDKFLNMDLTTVRGSMADSQFLSLVSLKNAMRKSDAAAEERNGETRNNTQIVNDALNEAGINTTAKTTSAKAQVAAFRDQYMANLNQYEQTAGKKAGDQEKKQIADGLLVNVITNKGYLWDTTKPLFQVPAAQTFSVGKVSDIPPRDLNQIDQALRSRGIPVTDQMRLNLYTQRLRSNRGQ